MPRISFNQDVVIPCQDCGTTDGRDYSLFLSWLDTPNDMERLLSWVKVTPCSQCQVVRRKNEKESSIGGRPKRKTK
jgi:hypothetical protein